MTQLPDPGHGTYFKTHICNSQDHKEAIFVKSGESSFNMFWVENLEVGEVGSHQRPEPGRENILETQTSVSSTLNSLLPGDFLVSYLTNCPQPDLDIKAL